MLKEWAGNKPRPVYCLAGEERSFKNDALEKLLSGFKTDAFNFSQYDGETADINDLVSAAMTPSFMGGIRLLLFKSAEKLKKEQAQRLAEYLQNPSNAATLLILLDKKTDSAELIIKNLPASAAMINFAPLEDVQAVLFAKKMLEREGLRASQEALELLSEMAGSDAMTIKQEAAKLAAWRHGGKKTLEPEDIMESAGFSKTLNPFALSNAILAKNGPLAADIADSMLREGVEAVGLVVSIARLTEKLLKVKKLSGDVSGENAAYALGLSPAYYRRLLEASRPFTLEKLLKNLNRCLEMEAMLKSSSGRDPGLLVKQLIFEITR
ncbi:MAG: DNA polymerase III subunit delta [Elusimicrobia bacterium]|nr:DNA polymerase III subunit delta [Elusimicrobiota bacterium]